MRRYPACPQDPVPVLRGLAGPWRQGLQAMLVANVFLSATATHADIAVVVNSANPVQALSQRQVAELYLGRTRTFESGQYAVVVDQTGEVPVRVRFFKDISGQSLGQVTAYWMRLKFTGQVQPPQNLDGDAAVLEFVRKTPTAIGYVSSASNVDAKVKTVLVLPEASRNSP